ncbi:non-ribosomal peptide synthetase, partial [Actinoplanes cyaneus]|uniref:non-ribosomal peptide synthetase n=1 Tax=Actinoplanes cyaneus TaxID=52696 RepID=UPI0031D4094E
GAVAAAAGIQRAGAAYVPLDPGWPEQRVADVLTDARVSAVVTTAGTTSRLAGSGYPMVDADTDAAHPDGPPAALLDVQVDAADPAYLIYTSGSTGEPKGVLVTHGTLAASTLARRQVYPGAPTFLLVSPLAFDSSVAGLWGTLSAGGTLVLATRDEVRDPARLVEVIHTNGVTLTLCVPSLYNVVLDAADRVGPARLASLDTVVVAGEPLPQALVERHFAAHPRPVSLVNEYGPTEATVWASYRRFTGPGPVSIGGPIPGTRLYVLDDDLRPVPPGAEGELVIGGEGVTAGYFGRPEATATAFPADPFTGDGARMYRTGDRARWNPDGTLAFLGRRDHQVKIRGHRIELGAVEEATRTVAGVRDAVVVPDGAHTTLVGFVLADPGTDAAAVRADLAERLPAAMVPARIRILEHFPLTFSGKVDRAQLQTAADEDPVAGGTEATDGGPSTVGVAAAWSEVLKVPEVPDNANFFDLGGHSLAMFQLQDALERHTGVRPSVVALFQHTTVAAQARLLDRDRGPGRGVDRSQLTNRRAAAVRARRERATRNGGRRDR